MKTSYRSFFGAFLALVSFVFVSAAMAASTDIPAQAENHRVEMDPFIVNGRHLNMDDIPDGSPVITIKWATLPYMSYHLLANGQVVTDPNRQKEIANLARKGFKGHALPNTDPKIFSGSSPFGKQIFVNSHTQVVKLIACIFIPSKPNQVFLVSKEFNIADQFDDKGHWRRQGAEWNVDRRDFQGVSMKDFSAMVLQDLAKNNHSDKNTVAAITP